MNRNRWLLLTAIALILSAGLTFLVYRMVQMRLKPVEQTTEIVVAAQKLALGARLTEKDVRLANWPKSIPVEGSFNDLKLVIGRGVVTSMLPNEPILDGKLAPKEGGAGLPSVIPDGMRAVAVKVNDVIGVAGFVLPGTRVDVIMTGAPKPQEDVASKVILENVLVLTAGQNVEQDANGKPQNVPVVTLLVTPEQAQDLALAGVEGSIQLALRNPLDIEKKNPIGVQRASLFRNVQMLTPEKQVPTKRTSKPKPKPAPVAIAPPAPPPAERTMTIELFNGRNKETLHFTEKPQ